MRILVVDDNNDSAESLAILLGLLGHDVQTASDGQKTLDLATTTIPELIILDIAMPNMSGHDVAKRLRTTPGLESVKLVAMTGFSSERDRFQSFASGFDAHMVKPVEFQALQSLLGSMQSA